MSDWSWAVPVGSAFIALAGGIYATRGKRATDRGDLADRLVDQVQEERNNTQVERDKATALAVTKDAQLERYVAFRQQDADYIVRLRRQLEAAGVDPEPYPGLRHDDR